MEQNKRRLQMTFFQLTPDKITEIQNYCNSIYDNSRKAQVKDHILDESRTGKEINLQGMGAEIWYKEKYNIPYNLNATLDEGPRTYKKDVDCIREGMHLEIKQTTYPTGCLFLNATDHYGRPRKLLADMHVLIIGKFPNYERDLYISNLSLLDKFFNKKVNELTPTIHPKIGKFGYHMEQDELFDTFEEAIEANGRVKSNTSTLS